MCSEVEFLHCIIFCVEVFEELPYFSQERPTILLTFTLKMAKFFFFFNCAKLPSYMLDLSSLTRD